MQTFRLLAVWYAALLAATGILLSLCYGVLLAVEDPTTEIVAVVVTTLVGYAVLMVPIGKLTYRLIEGHW